MAITPTNLLAALILLSSRVYGINVNDILNENYLPGSLLLENVMIDGENNTNKTSTHNSSNGSWNGAFSTMEFHRYVSLIQLKPFQLINGQNYLLKSNIRNTATCFGLC
jgi:hypothetical protein